MREITISVDGKGYPARETMGAMLRFKRATGREATEMDGKSITDMATYMWCCAASACKHDGVEFPYGLEDFCDSADLGTVEAWAEALSAAHGDGAGDGAEDNPEGGEKKRAPE